MLRNGSRNFTEENTARVRKLRANSSASEKVLWEFLRKRRLGGFLFRRQYPVGPYVLDFYCAEAKICIEVDGEQHAHRLREDEIRDLYLEKLEIKTMRISSAFLFEGNGMEAKGFLAGVETACRNRSGIRK
jgi:very-short-patch-repair endonuclease